MLSIFKLNLIHCELEMSAPCLREFSLRLSFNDTSIFGLLLFQAGFYSGLACVSSHFHS
jgi:hypothetical protein